MTKFLKSVDRVRSLVRGMEADVKSLEATPSKSFEKLCTRVKKSLEELSGEITNLYSFLEDSTISPLELEKRRSTIEDFESAQRLIENKLSVIEANPQFMKSTKELMKEEEKTIDELLNSTKNIKKQAYGMNNELKEHNDILAEIDAEVGDNLGLVENSINKLSKVTNLAPEWCLSITICVLLFILLGFFL